MVLGYSFLNATDLCRGDVLSKFLLNNSVDEKNQDTLNKFLSAKTLKLGNILDDDEILKSDMFKKVFLIESHMNEMRVLDNARQACSVESAARTNPDARIYLLLTTNSSHVTLKYTELTKVLLSYENIHIKYLNPYEFSKGTAIEGLIKSDKILSSKYSIAHMADAMRVLTLDKYAGLYLDLDVFSLVPLSVINQVNIACPEGKNIITNAVIYIDKKGQKVMDYYLKKLNSTYNPDSWGGNGPVMFSTSVRAFCNQTDIEKDKITKCDEYTILPTKKCYPIEYGEFSLFYKEEGRTKILEKIQKSDAYFVHIWNKMQDFGNQHFNLTFNSSVAYIKLAEKLCPQVLETLEKYFK